MDRVSSVGAAAQEEFNVQGQDWSQAQESERRRGRKRRRSDVGLSEVRPTQEVGQGQGHGQSRGQPRETRRGRIRKKAVVGSRPPEGKCKFDDFSLNDWAHHVVKLFSPLILCMVVVVGSIPITYSDMRGSSMRYTPFNEGSEDTGTKAWQGLANAGFVLCVMAFGTFILSFVFKHKCRQVILGWQTAAELTVYFFITYIYVKEIIDTNNLPMDYITLSLLLWNFGVTGMVCIRWQGPLFLKQSYQIFFSALLALVFIKYLPDWTTWTLLALYALWDLFAVLSPCGPLRMMMETARERKDDIFSSVFYTTGNGNGYSAVQTSDDGNICQDDDDGNIKGPLQANAASSDYNNSKSAGDGETDVALAHELDPNSKEAHQPQHQEQVRVTLPYHLRKAARGTSSTEDLVGNESNDDDKTDVNEEVIELGWGDFIFYSILVGKASLYGDWNATLAGLLGILIGLCLTVLLLTISRKDLPGLPISITLGLTLYFLTSEIVTPFINTISSEQIFF